MSYFRICTMRSIQKTTFCGFIALLKKVLDFGGQLADKFRFILVKNENDLAISSVRFGFWFQT